ncbi:hypothetical protein DSO57_1023142 [Entomophthora muscae]|uniref:Uncharacterized protein n=1 Tax=Entomophthora muscae TaxID=34485 RepID=A0ACC2RHR3_9FUNG|nr:hypothetical protein DSO57_1023142 [Entomophthora muscae]
MAFRTALFILSLSVSLVESGMLSGSQPVTTNYYHIQKAALNISPVACGIYGNDMDVSRITAVQGLTFDECGTCLRVSNPDDSTKFQFVMAVDRGGRGLDLNMDTFKVLFNGQESGAFMAKWEVTESSHCAGIITGNYTLPAYKA